MLGLGLGRAILFLRQHDARPYRDAILHACTHWTGYDQQVEGTRTTYLRDVLNATGNERWFVPRMLAALKHTTERRDATQLVFLALAFAKDSYDEARTALYDMFDRNDTEEPFLGYDAIIRLDGLKGFLYVAERMGAALLNDPHASVEADHARWEAKEAVGEEAVQRVLAEADTPALRAFAQTLEWDDEDRPVRSAARPKLDDAPYDQIRQQILESSPPWSMRGLMRWGERANTDDLTQAAIDLVAEQNKRRLRAYLEIFRRRAFPLEIDRLLALVRHQNDRIAYSAADALSRVAHPRVRALALDIIADSSLRGWHRTRGIDLLRSNFETGDTQLFAQLLEEPCEETGYHSIGFGIVDVLEENLTPEVAPVLRLLYERGPCTNCRMKADELLRQLAMLPAWLLNECRYDAGDYLRDAADAWSRGEEPADD